ncbi:MAG: type II toxin-antitoxin system VapC family toxin [Betaproteobacteria bacterium]|nr:MAG: type II toxin-antitoxin system VapC family toxin [Betaproteobacteria bacterium]
MRFWDASALVPLLASEAATEMVGQLYRADQEIAVAWTATIECASACVRKHRERVISDEQLTLLLERLRMLSQSWNIAEPTLDLRVSAERLVARHALRAGDAIQLASAIALASAAGPVSELVCFDRRLALAATTEGLRVVPGVSQETA